MTPPRRAALDTGFSAIGTYNIYAIAPQADGKVVVGGTFTDLANRPAITSCTTHADGSLDETFDPDADDIVRVVVGQPDGKLLIGGVFTTIGGHNRNHIARLNPDGSVDTSFTSNADDNVITIGLQSDGKPVIGGYFTDGRWTGPQPRRKAECRRYLHQRIRLSPLWVPAFAGTTSRVSGSLSQGKRSAPGFFA